MSAEDSNGHPDGGIQQSRAEDEHYAARLDHAGGFIAPIYLRANFSDIKSRLNLMQIYKQSSCYKL
jgi:hypothetical protein